MPGTGRSVICWSSSPAADFPKASVTVRRASAPAFTAMEHMMTRYYFNLKDGHTTIDNEGIDLPSLAEARKMAIVNSGEILKDGASEALWGGTPWQMWVTDAPDGGGQTFFTLRFSATD